MKFKYSLFLAALLLSAACNKGAVEPTTGPVEQEEQEAVQYYIPQVSELTLRQKVGQMFNIVPYNWLEDKSYCTNGSDAIKAYHDKYPVGGLLIKYENIVSPQQIIALNEYLHGFQNYPLICVDEEGGTVARVAKHTNFNVPRYDSAYQVGSTGDSRNALSMGESIGSYLWTYGFDVDFAPVADVWTNDKNTVIGKRAFSKDPDVAGDMVCAFLKGLQNFHVEGCLKHFPGHGDTSTDSHYGYASTEKTWEQMLACEMIPFKNAIASGANMIMTAHISAPNVTGCNDPSTVSPVILTEKLRGELGYKGIIITDSMGMGAITKQFGSSEAAILAIKAGADIVLSPADFETTFEDVLAAVQNGTISEARIDESVARILAFKKSILKGRGQLKESK